MFRVWECEEHACSFSDQYVDDFADCIPAVINFIDNVFIRCLNLHMFKNIYYLYLCSEGEEGEVVPLLNELFTTPWRRMGEWMYRSIFPWPQQ
jgi:hypothetical protein